MRQRCTLVAAASLLAASAGALAQQGSSVQVYGVLDLAVASITGASGGVAPGNAKLRQVLGGGLTTSTLGFRGSEDLGGGLTASFDLASFMRVDTGQPGRSDAIGAPVNVAADPFWSKFAWVGLSSASLGRLRLGNTSTPLFVNAISSNAFGDSTVLSPLNLVTFIGSPLTGGTGWTNQIVYDTPRFADAVSATLAVSASEGQGGRNTGWRVVYASGPLTASIAGQDVKKNPVTFADGTSPNNTASWQLGASYDFKVAKLFAHLGRIRNKGTEAAPLNVDYTLWEVSAAVPMGSGRWLAGYASRKTGDTPAPVPATAAGGNVERQVLTFGYDHDLSKRTDAYAMVMRDKTRTRLLPAPPAVASASGTSLALGLRHRF
jgi:predicted porin